jgi:integrase
VARGSISKLKRAGGHAYRVRVELPPDASTGVRRWRSETAPTRKAAEARLRELLADPAEAAATTPLADYLREQWLPYYARTYRASSFRQRETQVRLWLVPHLGGVRLGELTPGIIERGLSAMAAAGASPGRVREVGECLSSALTQAVRWDLLPRNPAARVRLPVRARVRREIWTPAQAAHFLETTEGAWGVLWQILARTGMRLGEAMALSWRDVLWEVPAIRVERTVVRIKGGEVIGPPKSAAGVREVVIGSALLAVLRAWQREQAKHLLPVGRATEDWLLTRPDGRRLASGSVQDQWRRAVAAAGLPATVRHDLRHLATSVQLAAGTPLKTVSARLGHSSIAITADLYGHVLREHQGEAAAVLDAAFTREAAPVVKLRSDEG